jgi:predicted anti-sigma-YlaC factor YlaD
MKRLGFIKLVRSFGKRVLLYMPLMITCREFENFMIDYLEDELPNRQKFVFELHLKTCSECRDYMAAYKRIIEVSSRVAQASESEELLPDVPEDFIKAILAARKDSKIM